MDARAGALADDEVDAIVLHRGIENFFDGGHEAMNFVEEKNFARLDRGEHGGEIALAFKHWAGTGLDGDAHFAGDDLRESCFAEAWRAKEQDVVEGFVACARRFNEDGEIFFYARIAR